MAVVDGIPGFTQLTKLNILDELIVQGTATFNGDVSFAGTVTNTGRWAWQLNTTAPASGNLPNDDAAIHLIGDNPFPADLYLENRSDRSLHPSRAPTIVMRRVGDFDLGVKSLEDGDALGHWDFFGWETNSEAYIPGASIDVVVDGTPIANKIPTAIVFNTYTTAATPLPVEGMRFTDNGNALLTLSSTSQGFLPPVMTLDQRDLMTTLDFTERGMLVSTNTTSDTASGLSLWTGRLWLPVTENRVEINNTDETVANLGFYSIYAFTNLTAPRSLTINVTDTNLASLSVPWRFIVKDESGAAGSFPITITLVGLQFEGPTNTKVIAVGGGFIELYAIGSGLMKILANELL